MLEYFGIRTDHISVRTSFYTGISETASKVRVYGLDYLVENLKLENALLIVDDVYDSGRSIKAMLDELTVRTRQSMPQQVKIASPWYKSANNKTGREPDYYVHTTERWLVFPHEILGLSEEELIQEKGELMKIIQSVNCDGFPLPDQGQGTSFLGNNGKGEGCRQVGNHRWVVPATTVRGQ